MQLTRKCAGCKESFRKTELVEYFSPSGKSSAWYCPKCLEDKQARERFSNKVCQIFGIKSPGPIIWTQRKRLISEYGYTDDVIIDCLDYIYNVEKIKKISESLYFVKPDKVERMKAWKRAQTAKASGLTAAMTSTEMKEYIVPIRENNEKKKEIDISEGVFDD